MKITIDKNSGYCFGVEYAIEMAEEELENGNGLLYCLGDIVHNSMEVKRLSDKGLRVISHHDLPNIKGATVLIRAHGEPPSTYKLALENNITLIDASCPVVLKLQNRIKSTYKTIKEQKGQIVIYGKEGHAEVIGLKGQTNEEAIVITGPNDLDKIDYSRPITLYSQTTKSTRGFYQIKKLLEERLAAENPDALLQFKANDSICRQVSNREPQLTAFAQQNDVIVFVSGKKSSNGKALHKTCQLVNNQSYFIENEQELNPEWFANAQTVGVCGATSTPMWLMERVAKHIASYSNEGHLVPN